MTEAAYTKPARAAAQLGVPEAWLVREASEGRVPCLRAGRRWLFNIDEVRRTLDKRAERDTPAADAEGGAA